MSTLKSLTGVAAAVLFVAMATMPAFAAKMTPATDMNTAVPAVPRAIPDLIPYHKFDPPASSLFDISKLTISGDIRVRAEYRNSERFGLTSNRLGTTTMDDTTDYARPGAKRNRFFVQQWTRLGIHYAVSPDVVFFFQPQYSKNWGADTNTTPGVDPNSSNGNIFARQAYMLIRNFITPNLTVKAGRQLVVWGNHRMFGHFDWNNVGWSFDGVTADYRLNKSANLQVGWLRVSEGNCSSSSSGGCANSANTEANRNDSDVIYVRAPMKVMGITLEPTWIWHNGGTNGDAFDGVRLVNARPVNQTRHSLGGRATTKIPLMGARVDATLEGYHQSGKIGRVGQGRNQSIDAYAFHADAGVTLPVPMQPRIGGEFNVASGDDANNDDFGGFDQLYPTNHIHFGYMDRMSWKNMIHVSGNLQLRPSKSSHFEVSGHWFFLNEETDHWYGANQSPFILTPDGNKENALGNEIDAVYTMFFTPDNHVGWQIGGGIFFPGDFVESNPAAGNSLSDDEELPIESWGYTQLWINF